MSPNAVSDLVAAGMPATVAGRGKPRLIHIRTAHEWLVERAVSRVTTPDGGETKEQAELRKARADADLAELRASAQRGAVVEIEAMGQLIDRVMTMCATQLDGLGGRMAGRLAGESDHAVIRKLLLDECRAIRAAMAAEFETVAAVDSGSESDPPATDEDGGPVGGPVPNPAGRKRRARAVAQ